MAKTSQPKQNMIPYLSYALIITLISFPSVRGLLSIPSSPASSRQPKLRHSTKTSSPCYFNHRSYDHYHLNYDRVRCNDILFHTRGKSANGDLPSTTLTMSSSPSPNQEPATSEDNSNNKLDIDGKISSFRRLVSSLPKFPQSNRGDAVENELDKRILTTALPSIFNLLVVPIINAIDTFYVGRLRDPLALAAQSAANQCFFTVYFLAAFLPTITAPLVAQALGKEDWDEGGRRVCEGMFLGNVLGGIFWLLLGVFPRQVLTMVLSSSEGAGNRVMEYAIPYLRWRAWGMIPALFSATGFAAYRGMLNTVTPLKVSLVTNLLNGILDPIFIVWSGLGAAGAALATSISEWTGALIYLRLLIRRKLVNWKGLITPPKWEALVPLIQGGLAMLLRQATLNVAFVSAARRAQGMDASGVAGAAYGITMQIYSLGVVAQLGVQGTAAALVPSARAIGGDDAARNVADRIFGWGMILGVLLALVQWTILPVVTPLFSPLEEIREAVKGPARISSIIHLVNGLVFAGEGTMLGLGSFRDLALITAMGVAVMVGCLASPLGGSLNGVLISLAAFNFVQGVAVTIHHVRVSPLRRRGFALLSGRKNNK
mmetsp:Transcript_9054/g.18867  ORF Transcript_9054/g.18867 Transcript_9054/m.18867 type:complete len:600 (+) Transcript_9054:190-1989(+)